MGVTFKTPALLALVAAGVSAPGPVVSFGSGNGITFGIAGNVITASVAPGGGQSSLVYSNANNVTFGQNGSTLTASASFPVQTVQTQGVVAPSAGTQTAASGTVVFANSNGLSFGMSGSNQITGSYTVPSTAGLISGVNVSAGTTSQGLSAITYGNGNGVSFGLNAGVVTGSIAAQTNQTEGRYAIGNTTGQSSSSTFDARTLSISGAGAASVGYSGNALVVSVPAVVAQTAQTIGLYAVGGTTGQSSSSTLDARTISFDGAGAASVGLSAGSVIVSVPTQSAQTQSNVQAFYDGANSISTGTIRLSNANGVAFGINGQTITVSYSQSTAPAALSAGTTLASSGTIVFSNSNGISFGFNGNTLTMTVQPGAAAGLAAAAAGTQSATSGTVVFANSNGVTFGMSGSSQVTASVAAQTAQTVGLYGLGNTTQNSSTTLDARTLSFNGLGNITVGYSNGTIQLSGSQSAQTQSNVQGISAGTQVGRTSDVVFSNSNGISFGMSNSSVVTASYTVPTQSVQPGVQAISAGTQSATTGTLVFSNSNGISFGIGSGGSTSQLTASYTVPSTAGLLSAVNVSAGTTSGNLSAFTLSNANGISFGLNASTITASYTVPNVPAQTVQTLGLFASSNTTQSSSTTLDARSLTFQGAGGVSVGYSNGSVVVSGASPGAPNINVSAGTTSNNLTAFVLSNANNVSFGLNGSTVTATVTVPAQSAQTLGLYATGNTTQGSSTVLDARSLSFNALGAATMGYSNGSIQVSVPTQSAQTQSLIAALYDGANSISAGTVRFTNANGVSFSINGQTISGSVAAQSNQTVGLYAVSNTTQSSSTTLDARSLSFQGAGVASVGYSNGSIVVSVPSGGGGITGVNLSAGTTSQNLSAFVFSNSNNVSFGLNGSTVTGSASFPAQTAQTIGLYAVGNTTQNSSTTLDARTLSFDGLGAATVGFSNGSVQVSVPVQTAQTQSNIAGIYDGANSISTGTIRFTNANGVSFSVNGQTLSASVAAQSAQTLGFYATSNTTGASSSSTFDARSLTFQGAGILSVGYSNGSVVLSVPSGGGAGDGVNILAAGTQTANTTGSVLFQNSNGVTFGMSNNSVITASVAAGGGGALSLFALGNTTQNSSTTVSAASVSFNGLGAMSVGYSNGSIQLSAPPSSSLVGAGLVSISTNGSTISISGLYQTIPVFEPYPMALMQTGSTVSSHGNASFWFDRVVLPVGIAVSNVNVIKSISVGVPTATSTASSGHLRYSYSHGLTLFTRQNYGTASTNISQWTTASLGVTADVSFTSTAQSMAMSWATNTTGGTTSFSTTSSNNAWSSFWAGMNLFQIPLVTTVAPGEYFVAHAHSFTTASTGNQNTTILSISNVGFLGQASVFTLKSVTTGAQIVSSNWGGIGVGIASAVTTNATMAASVISNTATASNNRWYMNFSNA